MYKAIHFSVYTIIRGKGVKRRERRKEGLHKVNYSKKEKLLSILKGSFSTHTPQLASLKSGCTPPSMASQM